MADVPSAGAAAETAPKFNDRWWIGVGSLPGIVLVTDALALISAGSLSHMALLPYNSVTFEYYVFAVGFVTLVTITLLSRSSMYEVDAVMRPVSRSDFIIVSVITAFLLFLTIVVSLKAQDIFAKRWLLAYAISAVVALVAARLLIWQVFGWLGKREIIRRRILVLGTGKQAQQFLSRLDQIRPYFTSIDGIFTKKPERIGTEIAGRRVSGDFEQMIAVARRGDIDDIVIALPWSEEALVGETLDALRELPINVSMSTDLVGYKLAFRPVMGSASQLPVFEVVQRPISGWSFVLKRLEDYVIATVAIIVLSPLLLLTAIAIKLDSPGPVFFRQRRLGFNNDEFEIYKFRSMYHRPQPEVATPQATKDDPRITRVGHVIRRTSIDELPQLFNVLNGTMSLVGPRPHAIDHNADFGRRIRGYFVRHKVKPGITGWAQVCGLRGETPALDKMQARVEHDIYYAENWSLLFDLRILVQTVFVVLFQRNAY
ncbi:MAG: undecaprenyl-phosphate glucose phosphotransferase [Pseudomonadota bacterium]